MKIHVALILVGFCLVGCASNPKNKAVKEKWMQVMGSKEFQDEKKLYKDRMKGLDLCWNVGIDNFLNSNAPTPESNCLYFSSKMTVYNEDDGLFFKKNVLRQSEKQLKVLQITSDGFIVRSPSYRNEQVIYIKKTDEKDIVDGSFLDPSGGWNLFKYIGTYKYQSLTGLKTVHAFEKLQENALKPVFDGFKQYGVSKEFFIQNELWDYLNK